MKVKGRLYIEGCEAVISKSSTDEFLLITLNKVKCDRGDQISQMPQVRPLSVISDKYFSMFAKGSIINI
jgi:hypothetical protein